MSRQDIVQRCYEEACTLTLTSGLCRVSSLASVLQKYGCSVQEVSVMLRGAYRSDIPEDEVADCCNGIVSTPWSVTSKPCISPSFADALETVLATVVYYPDDIQMLYGRGLEPVDVPTRCTAVSLRGWEFARIVVDGETVFGISEYLESLPAPDVRKVVMAMMCVPAGPGFHDSLMSYHGFRPTLQWTTTFEYLRASTGCGGRMLYDPRSEPMPYRVHDVKPLSVIFDGIIFAWADSDKPFTMVTSAELVLFGTVLDDDRLSSKSLHLLARIMSNLLLCQRDRVRLGFKVPGIVRLEEELHSLGIGEYPWVRIGEFVEVLPDPIIPPVRGVPAFRQVLR